MLQSAEQTRSLCHIRSSEGFRRKESDFCGLREGRLPDQRSKRKLTMGSMPPTVGDICLKCRGRLSPTEARCPTCGTDVGAPNVRRCRTDENLNALVARREESRSQAGVRGCSQAFSNLEAAVREKSGVVVSMPAGVARRLFEDPSSI